MGGYLNFGRFGGGGPATSIEVVELTLTGSTATVNLTKGQNYAQCVPFASFRPNYAGNANYIATIGLDVNIIDNSGTAAVQITRNDSDPDPVVTVYVLELGEDFSVQNLTWGPTAASSLTVACSAVDTDHAFMLVYGRLNTGSSLDDWDAILFKATFNSSTEIALARHSTDSGLLGRVFVVEDTTGTHIEVQTAAASRSDLGNTDVSITAVDPTRTMLIGTFRCPHISGSTRHASCRWWLLDEDTVRLNVIGIAGDARDMACQVVEWIDDTVFVQHFAVDLSSDASENVETTSVAITAVDAEKSIAMGTQNTLTGANAFGTTIQSVPQLAARLRVAGDGESVNVEQYTTASSGALTFHRGWVAEFTL